MISPMLSAHHFYLVGIKGVAMTALAQCLIDMGKSVRGSDVAEDFVTAGILNTLPVSIDESFSTDLPAETEVVIYTAAHQALHNTQVQAALLKKLPIFSHAEALGQLFNTKKGLAVCGVGGKSTTSAMIAWILEKVGQREATARFLPSFAVGVGNIPGIERTGQWRSEAEFMVAEADEYVTDPTAPSRGEPITPRFSYLNPFVTICTNLSFDHPDVYRDFAETKIIYGKFFQQIRAGGLLIANVTQRDIFTQMNDLHGLPVPTQYFGEESGSDLQLVSYEARPGQTVCTLRDAEAHEYTLRLQIPGKFNVMNALAALLAVRHIGVSIADAAEALLDFRSTMRRGEFIGEKTGVKFYDDYAHHPNEVKNIIRAFREWFPEQRLVVAFQSHTFSRTKALFNEFVDAFADADEVAMIDIFASAREKFDDSVSSDLLCDAIEKKFISKPVHNFHTLPKLAEHLSTTLRPGDVCLTVGAGDIYKVHELLKS